jgi:hypothetical protein
VDNKKAFIKGMYVGLGFLLITVPFILGIGIVQATNFSQFIQPKSTFAPNSNIYVFEQKDVDTDVATTLEGTIQTFYKNYRTADGKLVDIVILNSAKTATSTQQSSLQSTYPTKIITGTTIMPAPLVAPLPSIKKNDVMK